MDKFIQRYRKNQQEQAAGLHARSQFYRLPLHTGEGITFVNTGEILHAEANGSYTVFYLQGGRKVMVCKPLGDYEERLTSLNFFRIHNSHMVNLDQVLKYVRGEGGHVIMSDQAMLPVSRTRKDEFLQAIGL
jgi:two-component system LytT family response regulator